ncbi:MAG: ribbon-helix-helix domain-containing protein [Fervidicoccaceae archaeon]
MKRSGTALITCKVPYEMAKEIDELVSRGRFESRSDAIRFAIGLLLSTNQAEEEQNSAV